MSAFGTAILSEANFKALAEKIREMFGNGPLGVKIITPDGLTQVRDDLHFGNSDVNCGVYPYISQYPKVASLTLVMETDGVNHRAGYVERFDAPQHIILEREGNTLHIKNTLGQRELIITKAT